MLKLLEIKWKQKYGMSNIRQTFTRLLIAFVPWDLEMDWKIGYLKEKCLYSRPYTTVSGKNNFRQKYFLLSILHLQSSVKLPLRVMCLFVQDETILR